MPRGLICKLLKCNLGKVFYNFETRHTLEYFWQKTHWNKMKERAQAIKKRGFLKYSLLSISFLHPYVTASLHDTQWIFNSPSAIVLLPLIIYQIGWPCSCVCSLLAMLPRIFPKEFNFNFKSFIVTKYRNTLKEH